MAETRRADHLEYTHAPPAISMNAGMIVNTQMRAMLVVERPDEEPKLGGISGVSEDLVGASKGSRGVGEGGGGEGSWGGGRDGGEGGGEGGKGGNGGEPGGEGGCGGGGWGAAFHMVMSPDPAPPSVSEPSGDHETVVVATPDDITVESHPPDALNDHSRTSPPPPVLSPPLLEPSDVAPVANVVPVGDQDIEFTTMPGCGSASGASQPPSSSDRAWSRAASLSVGTTM